MEKDFPEYWKTIVDTMMDGVVVVDREGIILSVNKALERITGYRGSELVGRECRILDCDTCFSSDGAGMDVKECRLFTHGSVVKRRCRLTRKNGTPLFALKNAAVLRNAAGAIVGGVETLTDITDLVAKERTIKDLKDLLSPEDGFEGIVGRSSPMRDVYALISNAAVSDAPIIIYGESGTGKELVADAIHRQGKRRKGPFVKVNCAALAESLLESELFGHVRGAFTGAEKDRRGRFESAHKGDLFLDEIGDIPLATQAKLLRVLQEKEIERVGDHRPISIDTRIITATHRDIEGMCRDGLFRDDLFYRLNVIPIRMPPLRERREDIPILVDHFIRMIRVRSEKEIQGVTEEAMEQLSLYRWPGNVRELINVLEYAFVVCHDPIIAAHHLPALRAGEAWAAQHHRRREGTEGEEKERLVKALEKSGGNRQAAADFLGISRVTLWKLLKKHGIRPSVRFG